MVRRSSSLALLLLSMLLGACEDDGDGADESGDAPGAACEIDSACPDSYSVCFGVGFPSSCRGRGLCAGAPGALTCAYECGSDADCAEQSPTAVCFFDCIEPLFDGYCVEPTLGATILGFPFCDTPDDPRGGVAGGE
jgi:hypothetical protein